MKLLFSEHKSLIILSVLFFFAGCKQPETVVIEQSPTALAPSDTVSDKKGENEAGFRQLLIGEYQPVRSLDPLFADRGSSMRAVQLVYEGLVRLNEEGDVVPGIAQSWEIGEDSLTYTFKLRPDIYYHDSKIFSTGTGRKLKARDVKYVFERMARSDVPPLAARLFMDIQGFNSYFQEQHLIYNPEERKLEGIRGIDTPDEQTVVFNLENRDPRFLKKLATPLAVVYPQEAVGAKVSDFRPVGTGPFTFSRRTPDSTLIFSKFQNYYGDSEINLNRVDIKIKPSETQLFQSMSAGDLYLLPQLGPQLITSLLNNQGELREVYAQKYALSKSGGAMEYVLRHYTDSYLSKAGARSISSLLSADSTAYFDHFPGQIVSKSYEDTTSQKFNPSALNDRIFSVYYEDPFIHNFLGNLSKKLAEYNSSLQMLNIRAPFRDTGLFFTQNFSLIPNRQWNEHPPLFRFKVKQLALQRSKIRGLNFNKYTWWFDLRGVTLPADENMN